MLRVAGQGEPQRVAEAPGNRRPANVELRATLMGRLVSVSETLRSSPSVEYAFAAIGRAVLMLTGATRSAVFLRSQNGVVTCPWSHNLSDEYIGQLCTPADTNPWSHLSRHPELACLNLPARSRGKTPGPSIVEDIRSLPNGYEARRTAEREGLRALCSWPLGRGGRVVAAIAYYFDAPHVCSAPEHEIVLAFTLQVTATLEQAATAETRGQTVAEGETDAAHVAETEGRLEIEAARLAAMQRALDAEGAHLAAERTAITGDRERLSETRRALDAESERIAATRAESDAERERLSALRRHVDAQQAQLEALRRELGLERQEITAWRNELDGARVRLTEAQGHLEAERAGLADARRALEDDRRRLADAERDLAASHNQGVESPAPAHLPSPGGDGAELARAVAELAHTQTALDTETARLRDARRELDADRVRFTEAQRALEADRTRFTEAQRTFDAERARLEDVCRTLESEKAALTAAHGALAAECARLSSPGALTDLARAAPPVSAPAPAEPATGPEATAEPVPATTPKSGRASKQVAEPTAATKAAAPASGDRHASKAKARPRQGSADQYRERLAGWAEAAARELGCKEDGVLEIRQAALLNGSETPEGAGAAPGVLAILRHRWERWDGAGQPDGLKQDAIPLGARILAVAASHAEMITGGPGVPMLYYLDAKAALKRDAGAAFDPEVVEVFCRVVER